MHHSPGTPESGARRRALALIVNTAVTAIGGALAALMGVFAVKPTAGAASRARWLRAGTLGDLTPDVPVPRVLAVPRIDGWYRARSREVVFLVWDGARQVQALSATCTHLGCQVHWDGEGQRFRCPCHGGEYGADGRVLAGPPPRPLNRIEVRVDGSDNAVLVRL